MAESVLRRLATDDEFVKKRLTVLDRWIDGGEIEPWLAVVLAEWCRTPPGRKKEPLTHEHFENLFLDEQTFAVMREQVDGPWMIYFEQCRGLRANDTVMTFLTQLESISTQPGS
ncbi:MAG: hypothetical protein ACAI38_21205 [Myxococcota bacterium]|nr:hypothetical protein [Myxococcota bacterium]